MKIIILTLGLLSISSCTSFPKQMQIEKASFSIVDFVDNDYFHVGVTSSTLEPISAPTIEIKFTGAAPFSYMSVNGFQQQMRCAVYKTEDEPFTNIGFGRVYFEKLVSPKNSNVMYRTSDEEIFQYVAYAFRGLTLNSEINGPQDINLTATEIHHIECDLWGVKMLGPYVRSNKITISKNEFLNEYDSFLARPKSHNIQTLQEWLDKIK